MSYFFAPSANPPQPTTSSTHHSGTLLYFSYPYPLGVHLQVIGNTSAARAHHCWATAASATAVRLAFARGGRDVSHLILSECAGERLITNATGLQQNLTQAGLCLWVTFPSKFLSTCR